MSVGPPKTDGSWWRGLTECCPQEKGMANHFSILALRTPWTIWKYAVASALCSGPENLVSQKNWWKDNLVSSGRKEEEIGIQLQLIGQLEPVSLLASPSVTPMAHGNCWCSLPRYCLPWRMFRKRYSGNYWRKELACCPRPYSEPLDE